VTDATHLDVLYVTDLRFPGGSSTSLSEEVIAAVRAGYRVGALHARSVSLRAERSFHPKIQGHIDSGDLVLVRPGERVRCGLAVVKHPTALVEPFGGRLPVRADAVAVFVGQVPVDEDGTVYYRPRDVHANVEEAFGESPTWHPVSPVVRRSLDTAGVPMAGADWPEVIDAADWAVVRTGPRGDIPIIGRHGRPSPLKWPSDPNVLAAVYPLDGSAEVHVLGGVDGLDGLIGSPPLSWKVWGFNAVAVPEFLAGIDFFVYYHHPGLSEAFGRVVIEAMSSGCVAILPPTFAATFGDGCLYAEPEEVRGLIESLHGDPEAFMSQSRRATESIVRDFSHAAHVSRLRRLVGEPKGRTGRASPRSTVPPGLLEQQPVVLVFCVGLDPRATADTIRAIMVHRDRTTTFVPVVLCDSPAPLVAAELGEDLELDQDRKCFVGLESGVLVDVVDSRESFDGEGRWEDHVLRVMASIRRRRRTTGVVVVDPAHPDAWLALQVAR